MLDLKEKNRSHGRARAEIAPLVHRVTGGAKRIALGVIEENEPSASRLIARIGNVPAISRRDAKRRRHLPCRSSTSIFFRKRPLLKMSQPRSKRGPQRIQFMRWRVCFCRNRSAIMSGSKRKTRARFFAWANRAPSRRIASLSKTPPFACCGRSFTPST